MTLWRFSYPLFHDRRDTARAYGRSSDSQGAASQALARPGDHSAVREPQAASLETGRAVSRRGSCSRDASRIAEPPYPLGPLASRKAPGA